MTWTTSPSPRSPPVPTRAACSSTSSTTWPSTGAERLQPASLAALTKLEVAGQLTATQAKTVLADLVAAGGDADPAALAAARGFEAMGDDALASAVDQAIAGNGAMWEPLRRRARTRCSAHSSGRS